VAAARGDEWLGQATLVGRTPTGSQSPSRKRLKGASVKISARNKLVGTVTSITRGEAIANVVLDVASQRLIASITVEAVDELGLKEGMSVTAIVKASDVILATEA
jgi:molybdopterin-binding protein